MSFLEFVESAKKVGRPCLSFEFFPPKADELVSKAKDTIARYAGLSPDFMTVTYGAGGGTRDRTRELTSYIAQELEVPAVAHLTCVGHSKTEIDSILNAYQENGVRHVLALRGDPPKDHSQFVAHPEGFSCARDLTTHIASRSDFSIAVAGYPEGHPEAGQHTDEMAYLKSKIDAGAEVVLTQLFFDPKCYFQFAKNALDAGITAPIIPGIMPISNVGQVKRFTSMCGATLPDSMLQELEGLSVDTSAVMDYGVRAAIDLCTRLLEGGAPGLHFYTLNKSRQVEEVCAALNLIVPE